MGIYKHPNSPYWYYSFTVNGKRITGSTKTTKKSLAKQIYETVKADYLRNRHGIQKKKTITLKRLTEQFLEWSKANKSSFDRDEIYVDHLLSFFGSKKDISDITSFDVEKYKLKRVKEVAPATVNKEVGCLRRMYNLAIQWGLASENPTSGVKKLPEPKRSFRWWTTEEIKKFLDACSDDRMRHITLVGINTGMRIGEILNMKWEDIDFDNRYITVQHSKNGEYRKVRMNDTVVQVLKGIEKRSEYVFANRDGRRYKRIIKAFKNTAKRAGIAPCSPHVMRHTFASHLAMLGVDPHTIMELGGWKSIEMVMRYCHLAPDHKQKAVERLDELLKNCLNDKNGSESK